MSQQAEQLLRTYVQVQDWCRRVEDCLAQLPDRERLVLEAMYGIGPPVLLEDIADELSIARSGVYRIRKKGLKNIWELFRLARVPFFWDDILEHMCYNRRK